jgi:uncharacterized protein YjbI with pentapeptide repeats
MILEKREISFQELVHILIEHRKWLLLGKPGDRMADLRHIRIDSKTINLRMVKLPSAYLQHAGLREANLREADLQAARFYNADLHKADLQWADLREAGFELADLQEANLRHADLEKAYLHKANLKGADLQGANLRGADLHEAKFQGADFNGANLKLSILQKANLQEAKLQEAKLQDANLQEANLQRANLKKAFLQRAMLQGANLRNAHLREAKLNKADFRGANLQGAHFQGARLREAQFEGASVTHAIFRDADLQDANFKGVLGLKGEQLGGTITTGAKLPNAIKEFKAPVTEASKLARALFVALILACVYCWITIASTTDANLITGAKASKLPVINIDIDIVGFYWAAPIMLLGLYLYFHFYLERIWEGLAGLPAIFPDGRRLDQIEYPWMLNGLIRAHFKHLKKRRPITSYLQNFLTILLAWWIVPITLAAFWIRYLPKHDLWRGTMFHVFLITGSVMAATLFQRLSKAILRGTRGAPSYWTGWFRHSVIYRYIGMTAVLLVAFGWISYAAINGNRESIISRTLSSHADLKNVDLKESFLERVDLRYANLYYVNLSNANLAVADFRDVSGWGSDYTGAIFIDADLSKASLFGDNLFKKANFEEATLVSVNLSFAELEEANFKNALLNEASFLNAKLYKANFQGAHLRHADLSMAILKEANLRGGTLCGAVFNGVEAQGADFSYADLRGANFQGANLWEASFDKANLAGADFRNLTYSENTPLGVDERTRITRVEKESLLWAKTLYGARFSDPMFHIKLYESRPELFQKPPSGGSSPELIIDLLLRRLYFLTFEINIW